jgi:hypothetical protein
MRMSSLNLERRERPGGGGRTQRHFLDFIIDGRPLLDHLASIGADFIGRLGWRRAQEHKRGIEHLLLKRPPDARSGRVLLLICPECGDLGCGAFTARVSKDEQSFVWGDFAFENDYEDAPTQTFPEVGPFHFEKRAYFAELDRHREDIR